MSEKPFQIILREGTPPSYYRGGHPLLARSWTRAISRAKRMTGEQIACFIAWAQSVHNCQFEIDP